MNLDKLIFEMYSDIMFSIENNLFEERLNSKESFRRAIALWKNLAEGKKPAEAKRILKAAKREGYTIKQKEILAYADEDISSMKAKKSVRRELRAKKKAKRDERFEQVKASVDEKDIEDKTRIELLAIAIKKGLKTTPKMNRADLIDLIQGGEEESKKQDKIITSSGKFKIGDEWSENFDYEGMLNVTKLVNNDWEISDLQKLHSSLSDVNFYRLGLILQGYIDGIQSKNVEKSSKYLSLLKIGAKLENDEKVSKKDEKNFEDEIKQIKDKRERELKLKKKRWNVD